MLLEIPDNLLINFAKLAEQQQVNIDKLLITILNDYLFDNLNEEYETFTLEEAQKHITEIFSASH